MKVKSRPLIIKNCSNCGDSFKTFASKDKKYCNRQCYFKSGDIQRSRQGVKHSSETVEKLKLSAKQNRDKISKGWFKPGHTIWDHPNVKKNWIKKGTKPPNFKGGYRKKWDKIKDSKEYKNWRKAVFKRDNYTCIFCGVRGVKIQADHIKPKAQFEELVFDLDNGRTLCVPCHIGTPTWGRGRI